MMLLKHKSIEAVALCHPARVKHEDRQGHDDELRRMAPRFAPVTFSELAGVHYLHFDTEWVRGAMRLSRPNVVELEYARRMMAWLLFFDATARADFHVVQLGLGAATLTKFCRRHLAPTQVTAVGLNLSVIVAARGMFGLPSDDTRLNVLGQGAYDRVTDVSHRGTVGTLQINLYDATVHGPMLDTPAFYKACHRVLCSPDMMTVNPFGDHTNFPRSIERICDVFGNHVLVFPRVHDDNVIALAFNDPPLQVSWETVQARVAMLQASLKLPTKGWVDGLYSANAGQEDALSI